MANVLGLLLWLLNTVVGLMIVLIIVSAVWSWLVAFNVVNTRNPIVYQVQRFLYAVTRPILWPLQKVIPPIGGIDITPIIAILVLQGIQIWLIRPAMYHLATTPF